MSAALPLCGTPIPLRGGGYAAEVASVGASLRSFTRDGRDLVVPFDADEVRPFYRGVVLVPWPNRVVDGRYTFAGVAQQLSLTEPERGNALHGLACWTDYRVVSRASDAVVLAAEVTAQAGYPHRLRVEASYRLDAGGLHAAISATNTGPTPAPYGSAPHPYLVGGAGRVDEWTVELAAEQVLQVDPDRLTPQGLAPVDGVFDLRTPTRIGDRFLDHAYTGLTAGVARLTGPGGGVELRWDPAVAPWVQVHTADRPEPEADRVGLAVEPMTCPPDAFNSGDDLVVLAPGASHTLEWHLRSLAA